MLLRGQAVDDADIVTTPAPRASFGASNFNRPAEVIIPPSLPGIAEYASKTDHGIVVTGDPGRDLAQRLVDAGALPYAHSPWDMADYDYVATLRSMVYSVAAVVMESSPRLRQRRIDRAISRRRELTSLRLVGIRHQHSREAVDRSARDPSAAVPCSPSPSATSPVLRTSPSADTDLAAPWEPTLVLAAVAAIGGMSSPRLP